MLSDPPPDGAVVSCGRKSSAEAWMGEKRRKAGGCPSLGLVSSSSDDATDEMTSILSQIQDQQGDHEKEFVSSSEGEEKEAVSAAEGLQEEFVFSEGDDISDEELSRCCKELRLRQNLFYVDEARKIRGKAKDDLLQRLCGLRLIDYKILKDNGHITEDTTNSQPVWAIEDADQPGPSMFGWTIDTHYFHLAELDDYQRIVPTRASLDEYCDWEGYRTTFSKHETDVDYVKYCAEISKKIKWIEKYLTQEDELAPMYNYRGARQARKIAAGFSHLPLSLATRGYDEYVWDVWYVVELKDYIRSYFEVWKRITKQEQMSFEDALKQTLSENTFRNPYRIKNQINGRGLIKLNFKSCLEQIPTHVMEDEALKLITDMVYSKSERTKTYVDYVKKKLEVALRIGVTSGMGAVEGIAGSSLKD